jgi:hypothetical protein
MEQPPADQRKVFLGVSLGLGVCAIPFLFKTVRGRELHVANMRDAQYESRDGGGSDRNGYGSGEGSNNNNNNNSGDGKEDARKERLSFGRRRRKSG